MKKIAVVSLFLAGLLLGGCGRTMVLGDEVNIEFNQLEGLSMEVVGEPTNRSATVRVTNETNTDYLSDILFAVHAERNGKWYGLVNQFEGDHIAELNGYPANSLSGEIRCLWNSEYGALDKGHYRIVYYLFESTGGVGERYPVAAEFFIQ